MTILSADEITVIVNVMDFMMKRKEAVTVAEIRQKFHLTSEEYNMIMDLYMPIVRNDTADKYRTMFYSLKNRTETGLLMAKKSQYKEALDYIDKSVERYRGLGIKDVRKMSVEDLTDETDENLTDI